jgi:hypothetical protein
MLTKGRKGGTRGRRGIWRGKKKGKTGEWKKVVRHPIETKCVGNQSALAGGRCHRSYTARCEERAVLFTHTAAVIAAAVIVSSL